MFVYLFVPAIFIFYFLYKRNAKIYSVDYPGPGTFPFVGNALSFVGDSAHFFKTITEFWHIYGTRFRAFIGNQLFILISDPKDVEVLLSSNQMISKSTDYEFIQPWLGTGLLTSTGEKWRKRRKVITPTFHFKILEHFIQVFDAQSNVLVKKLSAHTDGKSFDIFPHITLCALDVICEAAMGVSVEAQNNSDSKYVQAVKDICHILNSRMKNPFKRPDLLFMLSSDYWLQRKALKVLHSFTYKMIEERRSLLQKNQVNLQSYTDENADDIVLGKKKKLAFLDMLLLSTIDGKPLENDDIREEVDTFLFEGHDTTTSGIVFALYLISHYPEIQKKLFEEQMDIFGDDLNRPTLYNDLQDMKYMELAIKESLRLYPPVPMIARKVNEDVQINDMFVPSGSTLISLIYHMNRNPDVFPDADKFIPERFLPEETAKRSPFATVSFSAGPRNCIGQKFAILEMKSTISKVIRNYELLPSYEKVTLTSDLILKTVDGVRLRVAKRTR